MLVAVRGAAVQGKADGLGDGRGWWCSRMPFGVF